MRLALTLVLTVEALREVVAQAHASAEHVEATLRGAMSQATEQAVAVQRLLVLLKQEATTLSSKVQRATQHVELNTAWHVQEASIANEASRKEAEAVKTELSACRKMISDLEEANSDLAEASRSAATLIEQSRGCVERAEARVQELEAEVRVLQDAAQEDRAEAKESMKEV